MSVSIYDYEPQHFGDTILERVFVRDIQTCVLANEGGPYGVTWGWRYDQLQASFAGPYDEQRGIVYGVCPPIRDEVIADITATTSALLADGALRVDAFEEAS